MTSKLQIRAKILELIEKLDMNSLTQSEQEKIFLELKNFEDKEFLQQILLKELNSDDDDKIEKVAYIITEIADKASIQEPLWDYIKDKNISDKVKEIACTLLRIFGEKIHPEDLVNYLDNPLDLIDAETQKLLDVAMTNPEIQIDFLDFLFALPVSERLNLLRSLEADYQGERLVNIVSPILDASEDPEIREFIAKTLGNSKVQSAITPLKNIINYSNNNNLKKLAEIGLKKLRLSGVSFPENEEEGNIIDALACESSVPYKSYISMADGMGNQGVIISRFSDDESVQMFSVVTNDTEGIVDCFGFYALSKNEFERIVDSYDKDSINVQVPASFAKDCILRAEELSRKNQSTLSYEYLAWKSLLYDIDNFHYDFEQKAESFATSIKSINYPLLLDSEIFGTWFFDNNDNPRVDKFFNEILVDNFSVNQELDEKVAEVIQDVFDENTMKIYRNRLLNTMYLLDLQEEVVLRDNIAAIALQLKTLSNPLECELFTWIIRKSIYELFLRERASYDDALTVESNIFAQSVEKYQSTLSKEQISSIIDNLRLCWAG